MHGVETILNVLGSVCLLLWGVRMVRTGLTRAFGATLRRAIAACSRNRFTAFVGGLAITGLLQSSTATALLLSSFAGREGGEAVARTGRDGAAQRGAEGTRQPGADHAHAPQQQTDAAEHVQDRLDAMHDRRTLRLADR